VAELSASLAHEIKNPLASIRSAVEQLTRTGGGKLRKDDRDVLGDLVLTESDRLSRLLSGFIEFSRVEVRGRTRVDLAAVAREAIGVARQHPEARGVTVQLEAAAPVDVDGDPDLLHRVVFNLVLNALQHSGEGDTVTVEVVTVDGKHLPAGVALPARRPAEGRDRGPASAPRTPPASSTRSSPPARAAAAWAWPWSTAPSRPMMGMIFIDDTVEQGATFTVFLPASRAHGAAAPGGGNGPHGATGDSEPNEPERVLVIDDETSILHTIEILLRGEGFDVTLRTSGKAALEAWDDARPDIVLIRHPHARLHRHGRPGRRPGQGPRGPRHPHDRPGLAPVRHRGRQPRRLLLPPEALLQRRPRRPLPPRHGVPPS
jgi:hypothetical protein